MKLRQPWIIRMLGFLGALVLRTWTSTLRFQYRPVSRNVDPHRHDLGERYIYAMWHEYLLLPLAFYAVPDVRVLISHHADGQLLADICRSQGIPVIRGSTSRGGVRAVRELLEASASAHLSLSPDGPRGPRQRVQLGLVYLASRTGLAVVPVGFGLDRPRRLKSWDCFALPRPFARARCITGEPIRVPPHASADQLEQYRQQAESALISVTEMAERWAESGVWPGDAAPEPTRPPPANRASAVPHAAEGAP